MNVRRLTFFVAAAAATLLLITGCDLFPKPGGETGTLKLSVTDDVTASILLPNIDLTVATYDVTVTASDGTVFEASGGQAQFVFDSVAFGEATVTVDAFNADGDLIGTGSTTVTVITGETVTAGVTVVPIVGDGFLDLTVNWDPADVQTPSVVANLLPASGSAIPLPVSLGTGTATLTQFAVGNGYYTLQVQLFDNGLLVAGAVEVARFAAGGTTTGVYDFTRVNKPGGTIDVQISQQMAEPIYPVIEDAPAVVDDTASAQLTAVIDETLTLNFEEIQVSYVWYVNGDAVGMGDTFLFDAAAELANAGLGSSGWFYVDVVAFSADGTRAGSDGVLIQVQDLPYDITGVDLAPSDPVVGDTVTATLAGTFDAAQLTGGTVRWLVDGEAVSESSIEPQTVTIVVDFQVTYAEGSQLQAEVTLEFDALVAGPYVSDPVVVANSAPVVSSVTVTPSAPGTTDTLTASATASDPDVGDTLSLQYAWFVNGSQAGGGATLASFFTSKGDDVFVEVTASDGTVSSATVASATITIVNTPPSLGGVDLTPTAPTGSDTLTATPVGPQDADGDTLTFSYSWSVNGTELAGETGPTLAPSVFAAGDVVQVTVTPSDGTDNGVSVSDSVTIQ